MTRHLSTEHKRRISEAQKGKKLSASHKAKISKALTGQTSKLRDKPLSGAHKAKLSATNLRKSDLISARTKQLIKDGKLKVPNNKGRKLSDEHRASLSLAKKTTKELQRMRDWACKLNTSFDRRSKLESVVEMAIIGEGEVFEAQYKLSYFVFDFAIPSKRLLIEVDGCYWHGCESCGHIARPANRANDERKNRLSKILGWELLRIPEHSVKDGMFLHFLRRGGVGA